MLGNIQAYNENCIDGLRLVEDKSIDLVVCSLVYDTETRRALAPLDILWENYKRVIKDNGVVVLFGQGMVTADIMKSNPKWWRYNLVWDKVSKTGFLNSAKMPLRQHEDIIVFYKSLPTYNPQMIKVPLHKRSHAKGLPTVLTDEMYPTSIITVPRENATGRNYQPTQKPVKLLEYIIRTYTNKGDTVLDNCMGNGSTAVACINTGRNFIGLEENDKLFALAVKRISETDKKLF